MMELDLVEKQLLNEIQNEVPLVGRPFRDMGFKVGLDEDEVIRRVHYLKESGFLREVRAIIEWKKLGYQSTLVAMEIPPDQLERAADIINKHPGISHNYARNHRYNMWFTLTVPPPSELESVIRELAGQAGATAVVNLPAVKVFRIKAFFDMLNNNGHSPMDEAPATTPNGDNPCCPTISAPIDIGIIKELYSDMPIKRRPFDQMARRLDMYLEELLARAQELLKLGVIRRYAGVLRHRKAGFNFNVMSCWNVPPEKVDTCGGNMVRYPCITHCYERAVNGNWPYNVFAMIHGRSQE
ncbi:MAG: Lrp/AsnC family transcriptional regulator, partial [Dehalococcoidia bacterium]|nr:Lrp/AsnC family transcriptional regulator [Dehalococcoidia bacterium]